MKHLSKFATSLLLLLLICLSCEKNDQDTGDKGSDPVPVAGIKGLVEKGPFVSGSSVTVYELDEKLNATGRVFETKTNDEGAFSINISTSLVSKYVKISVNGFYFNEYTGLLSTAQISLDAITSVDKEENPTINANILTHLEMPRVLKLVSEGKSFKEAKEQAEKELLKAFLITDITINPESTSITGNNTSANILIAISSILLNGRSDAQLTEIMSSFRNDLEDGELTQEAKNKIKESSFELSYSNIKNNLKKRYEGLGKSIEIGEFELFIDGDGDGEIGDTYEENTDPILPENIFDTEEGCQTYFGHSFLQQFSFLQNQYLFDGVYTNTINDKDLNQFSDLKTLFDHNPKSNINFINYMWAGAYTAIRADNIPLDHSEQSEWIKKYIYPSKTYRAYIYLNVISLWGDAPLIVTTDISNINIGRTPKDEILDFIISELEESYQHLPAKSNGNECSKYFAKALLARAYLLKKDYVKALECANTIIDSKAFSLSNNLNSIYTGGSSENIFEIINEVESSYSTNDLYKKYIQKGNYTALARYAEILLIASESNLRLGNTSQAANLLDQVRVRNGKGHVDISSLEENLLTEWKDELRNEGQYFSALKRFGKAQQMLGIVDYKLLLPIPIQELNLNPMMTQNPGY